MKLTTSLRARIALPLLVVLAASTCLAQTQQNEGYFASIFRKEKEDIRAGCSKKDAQGKPRKAKQYIPSCGESLFHGNKGLYISFKNLAPQNGLALGALFKDSELNTANWRMSYQVDGEASFNGSYTAGALFRMQRAPARSDLPVPVTGPPVKLDEFGRTETLLVDFYAFRTSLRELYFFGLGPFSQLSDRTFFAFDENVAGVSADYPFKNGFHLLGELNGRWPNVNGNHSESSPSIEQLYDESSAPGLTRQPAFLQAGEGLQYVNNFGGRLALDYSARFQQYFAPSDSHYSFRRLRLDAQNEIYFIKPFRPSLGATTSERVATLQLRGFFVESIAPAGHVVPFYFQPTIGGGDIDKQRTLASFLDYRFRAPNALLLRAQYEQPVPKLDFLGVVFRYDTGKVALRRDDIELSHFRHSFGAGITIRAGNFPYVSLMYTWAGGEGQHTFVDVNLSSISSSGGPASLW